ncbi:CBL-interacting protein kinase 15-like [Gigantopelta aegis]|uniref:CBL-interacting protein kinase 15-like n=1 Tax=Gigantopelta aegis TaxID=1735272 RepID=UPI001B88804E|nr:CBL-interacting protein kinase 15-like [Gigantopelta aegis]
MEEEGEAEEEYVANIVKLQADFALKRKDEGWRPDKRLKTSLEKIGYTFGATIGDGLYSKVKRAYCRQLNREVAIKIIQKKKLPQEVHDKFLPREIALLQKLRHASLIVLHEVYDTATTLYLMMELAQNGDLLEYVNHVGALVEVDTRRIMHQLLDVVSYLHANLVYHRDIKLENILLDEFYNIRLSDFGFARYNPTHELLDTFCGSYAYAAPEVLNGEEYDGAQVDVWSMGVCMYAMLNGRLPFRDDDIDVLRLAQHEKVKFHKYVCKDGRDLLREFLNVIPNRRITIPAVRRSLWMRKPMKNDGQSMSSLSVTTVSSFIHPESLDPNAEHGFSCTQHSKEVKPMTVSNVLQAVAVNHSTGRSSVDLRQVIPTKKESDIAMTTGVSGPAGRRLSVKLGILPALKADTGYNKSKDSQDDTSGPATATVSGAGKAPLGNVTKSVGKFKMVAKAVTAMKRFHRAPLTTILSIPQEKAMEKVIHERQHAQSHEMKGLHYTSPSKVAHLCKEQREHEHVTRQRSSLERQNEQENRRKRRDVWDATMSLLTDKE